MDVELKIPQESADYRQHSEFVIEAISKMMERSLANKSNLIFIRTNLKRGLPLENINKVAGPFVEAWALEQFEAVLADAKNEYKLIHVEAGKRLDPYDVLLQFRRKHNGADYVTANVDVKATAENITTAGKSPNITSFAVIRTAYVEDPDYMFIVLSLRHKVYGDRDPETGMTNGIMEVTKCHAYDLKYLSAADLNYNRALGTGQLQIRDINAVKQEIRTTWEFLQMLDQKYIKSKGEEAWLELATKFKWIKTAAEVESAPLFVEEEVNGI